MVKVMGESRFAQLQKILRKRDFGGIMRKTGLTKAGFIERVEDEYYIRIDHEMTKEHYISFVAGLSSDKVQIVKLYPEGNPETRFKISGVKRIYFYCNKDGLYVYDVKKKK